MKDRVYLHFKMILIFFVSFILFNISVYAETKVISHGKFNDRTGSSGSGCPSSSAGYQGCYDGGGHVAFRFTMVDSDGKKIKGTHSVDLTGSISVYNFLNDSDYLMFGEGKVGYTYNGYYNLFTENEVAYKYSYKYSSIIDNAFDDVKDVNFYYLDNGPSYNGNYSSYIKLSDGTYDGNNITNYSFVNNLEKYYDASILYDYNGTQVSFIDLFLHYCGYLGDSSNPKLEQNKSKYEEIARNNYFILMEPIYFITYNDSNGSLSDFKLRYGTISEFANYIYNSPSANDGLVYSANGIVRKNACFVSTNSPVANFSLIKEDTSCNGLETDAAGTGTWYQQAVSNVVNTDYGYGFNLISISDNIDDIPDEKTFKIDLCKSNIGKVSLNTSSYLSEDNKTVNTVIYQKDLLNDAFKVSGDGNTAIYCYDNVSYNFSEVISYFKKQSIKFHSKLEIPTANVIINRMCLVPKNGTDYNINNELSDYLRDDIYLKLGNTMQYKFSPKIKDIDSYIGTSTSVEGYMYHAYDIQIDYFIDDNIIFNNSSSISSNGSIVFPDYRTLFGSSNKLTTLTGNSNLFVRKNGKADSDGTFTCDFTYEVSDEKTGLNFRVISLENPFPARDGTERLPGINWLNKNNYVFDYIINNRGIRSVMSSDNVSPEAMYDNVEPMYSVVLDPSTMIKIREYNKGKSYDSMLSGNSRDDACNDGRECISTFIRNLNYIPEDNLTGTCVLYNSGLTSYNWIRPYFNYRTYPSSDLVINYKDEDVFVTYYNQELTYKTMHDVVYNQNTYNKLYDLNNDYRNDTEDEEILKNIDKNIPYYTCANKTYKSGGPTKGGSE